MTISIILKTYILYEFHMLATVVGTYTIQCGSFQDL